jgi:hypothetical protein
MKHKLGPLPIWGWMLIASGIVGAYYLYTRNKNAATAAGGTTVLPDTGAATPVTPTDSGSGGSSGSSSPPANQTDVANLDAALAGLSAQISALNGGQGLPAATPTPTQTFAGEVTDVLSGVQALQALGLGVAQPTTSSTHATAGGSTSSAAGSSGRKLVSSTYEIIKGVAYNVHRYTTGAPVYVKAPTQPSPHPTKPTQVATKPKPAASHAAPKPVKVPSKNTYSNALAGLGHGKPKGPVRGR